MEDLTRLNLRLQATGRELLNNLDGQFDPDKWEKYNMDLHKSKAELIQFVQEQSQKTFDFAGTMSQTELQSVYNMLQSQRSANFLLNTSVLSKIPRFLKEEYDECLQQFMAIYISCRLYSLRQQKQNPGVDMIKNVFRIIETQWEDTELVIDAITLLDTILFNVNIQQTVMDFIINAGSIESLERLFKRQDMADDIQKYLLILMLEHVIGSYQFKFQLEWNQPRKFVTEQMQVKLLKFIPILCQLLKKSQISQMLFFQPSPRIIGILGILIEENKFLKFQPKDLYLRQFSDKKSEQIQTMLAHQVDIFNLTKEFSSILTHYQQNEQNISILLIRSFYHLMSICVMRFQVSQFQETLAPILSQVLNMQKIYKQQHVMHQPVCLIEIQCHVILKFLLSSRVKCRENASPARLKRIFCESSILDSLLKHLLYYFQTRQKHIYQTGIHHYRIKKSTFTWKLQPDVKRCCQCGSQRLNKLLWTIEQITKCCDIELQSQHMALVQKVIHQLKKTHPAQNNQQIEI